MNNFTASDGIRLSYVIDDFTDPWKPKETLFLLHAVLGSSRRFYRWIPALARHIRVVQLDMRGHGQSEVPDEKRFSAANSFIRSIPIERLSASTRSFLAANILSRIVSFIYSSIPRVAVTSQRPLRLRLILLLYQRRRRHQNLGKRHGLPPPH